MASETEETVPSESNSSDECDNSLKPEGLLKTPKRRTRCPPQNTPTVRTENSTKDTFLKQNFEERQDRFGSETKNWCYGPMPMWEFLLKFLPSGREDEMETTEQLKKRMILKKGNPFRNMPAAPFADEELMYEPIVRRPVIIHCIELTFVL